MDKYFFAQQATEQAKKLYVSVKPQAQGGTSFSGLRKIAQNYRRVMLSKKDEVSELIKSISSAYSSSVADSMISELKKQYSADLALHQEQLINRLNSITEAKKKAIEDFTMKAPADDFMKLYNVMSLRRKESISDTEWSYFVKASGENYQAMSLVKDIADKVGKTFVLPFTPDDSLKDLEVLSDIVSASVDSIDIPTSEIADSRIIRFYEYDGEDGRISDPYINGLISEMDESAGTVVPEEYKTITKRLIEAQDKAYSHDNVILSAKIKAFRERFAEQLATPEEIREQIYNRAEELISEVEESCKTNRKN